MKTLPTGITEEEFFEDLQKAKTIVDNGVTDYFMLINPSSFKDITEIGNTTLKDIVEVFGIGYILLFRFAGVFDCGCNGALKEEYMSFSLRPITKNDKARLRGAVTYFPKETWVCDWRDGTGAQLILPFVQNDETAEINWLHRDRAFVPRTQLVGDDQRIIPPEAIIKTFIERLPDYFDCQLAICKYKDTDIAIPIASKTAKDTFKNRERDESGVKRRICHVVKEHNRKNSDKKVERHLRGRSDIIIRGENIDITSPLEWGSEIQIKKELEKEEKRRRKGRAAG